MRTVWAITHEASGWEATETTTKADGSLDTPTGRVIGPFPTKPDLEAALVKAGVGFMDRKEI